MPLSRRTLLTASLAALVLPRRARAAEVSHGVDPRFEWLATLARAAGFAEYRGGLPAWTQASAAVVARVAPHRAVRMLWGPRLRGVAYDAIPSLAAHLGGEPDALVPLVPFDPWPEGLDERWRGLDLDRFVAAASDAARVSGFTELWHAQAPLVSQVEAALARDTAEFDLAWYERFFGQPLPGRVRVVGSLSSGQNNYGAHAILDGKRTTVAVLGVGQGPDGPVFPDLSILVHEVGHDFVNPLVRAYLADFEAAGRRLYTPVAGDMRRRAYGEWSIVVMESVLRACVVRYLAAHGGDVAAELTYQRHAGFPWTGSLSRALAAYEADRARWPTFESYVPELIAEVDAAATYAVERPSRVPRVTSMSPKNGARRVDPATTTLVVTFDRPMRSPGWAVVGGGPNFPETSNPRYDEARRVFSLDIALEPDHDYELWLNSRRFEGFHCDDGEPLEPVHVTFRTGKAR